MNAELARSLKAIESQGAAAFGSTTLAQNLTPTLGRVVRRRVARTVGVTTAALLAVAAIGVSSFAAAPRLPSQPGASADPSVALSPSVTDSPEVVAEANRSFTVVGGEGVDEIVASIAEVLDVPIDDVLRNARGVLDDVGAPSAASLEGWILPGAYDLDPQASVADALTALVAPTIAELDSLGVAPEDRLRVLTEASLIEKEAARDEDRPKVARVIENRLAAGMALELDSTVIYAGGEDAVFISGSDTFIDSPYNTYRVTGLPPGPIAAPSVSSIDAALHPADGPWLYLVQINLDTGELAFAATYAEHAANVEVLRAWMQANARW